MLVCKTILKQKTVWSFVMSIESAGIILVPCTSGLLTNICSHIGYLAVAQIMSYRWILSKLLLVVRISRLTLLRYSKFRSFNSWVYRSTLCRVYITLWSSVSFIYLACIHTRNCIKHVNPNNSVYHSSSSRCRMYHPANRCLCDDILCWLAIH